MEMDNEKFEGLLYEFGIEHRLSTAPTCGRLFEDRREKFKEMLSTAYRELKQKVAVLERRVAGSPNPWCDACTEKDCCVSGDGTCEMIRKYQGIQKLEQECDGLKAWGKEARDFIDKSKNSYDYSEATNLIISFEALKEAAG